MAETNKGYECLVIKVIPFDSTRMSSSAALKKNKKLVLLTEHQSPFSSQRLHNSSIQAKKLHDERLMMAISPPRAANEEGVLICANHYISFNVPLCGV